MSTKAGLIKEELYSSFMRALLAISEWAAHILVVLSLLGGFFIIEWVCKKMWPDGERMLFGKIPLSYLFDGADAAILLALLGYGVYSVMVAYVKKKE